MNEIEKLKGYLEEIIQACSTDAARLACAPHASPINAIQEEASRILSGFVLRFGVIGDSNAGKSLLVGGLIGKATALPVNSISFTGNISILRVRSDAGVSETKVGPYRVRFVSAADAREIAVALLDSTLDQLKNIPELKEFADRGRHLQAQFGEADPSGMMPAWIEKLWVASVGKGVDLWLRLIELTRFMLVWGRLGEAVCGTDEAEIEIDDKEIAEAAMVLPRRSEAKTFGEFSAEVNRLVDVAVQSAGPLHFPPQRLTKAFAEACYPLVRDVRIEVRVPQSVWNLSDLHVEALELFDFPGSAAQSTSARDNYLAGKERKSGRIHTWIVVINSGDLARAQAVTLVDGLPKDRIVAVANRFDDLPLRRDGHLEELRRLTAPESPARTQTETLNHLQPLRPLTILCEQLTRANRCAFVSALLGLHELDGMPAVRNNVLSEHYRRDWASDVANGREMQNLWKLLAGKIRTVEREAPLAAWLAAYSEENGQGGLQQLRRILFAHANDVGLKQLAEEIRNDRLPKLEQSIQLFLLRFDERIDQAQSSADEIRGHLDRLAEILLAHGHAPSSIDEAFVRTNGPASNGGLAPGTKILSPAGTPARSLRELIRDEVLMRVWEWPFWTALLGVVRPDGIVYCSEAKSPADADDEYDPISLPAPPLRVSEFHKAFRDSYAEVERIAVAGLRSALRDFLQGVASRMNASLVNELSPLAATSPRNYINLAIRLQDEQRNKIFFKKIGAAAPNDRPADPFWRTRFPFLVLPDDYGGLAPGPLLGWAPERRNVPCNRTEHQLYIFRLRNELASSLESAVVRHVSEGLREFRGVFQEMINQTNAYIDKLKDEPNEVLLTLFGRTSSEPAGPSEDLALRRGQFPS